MRERVYKTLGTSNILLNYRAGDSPPPIEMILNADNQSFYCLYNDLVETNFGTQSLPYK